MNLLSLPIKRSPLPKGFFHVHVVSLATLYQPLFVQKEKKNCPPSIWYTYSLLAVQLTPVIQSVSTLEALLTRRFWVPSLVK